MNPARSLHAIAHAVAVAAASLFLSDLPVHAAPATVVSVGDGDTLRVRKAGQTITIRLACIDAPESSQRPHGVQASQTLKALLPIGSGIDLRIKTTDRYGRSIAEITHGGRNINQVLVASGAAFVYWKYIRGCDRQTYSRLETEARLKGLGVWSKGGGITRPWDYRRGRRSSGSSRGGSSSGGRLTCKQIGSYAQAQVLLRKGTVTWTATAMGGPVRGCGGDADPAIRSDFVGGPNAWFARAPHQNPVIGAIVEIYWPRTNEPRD